MSDDSTDAASRVCLICKFEGTSADRGWTRKDVGWINTYSGNKRWAKTYVGPGYVCDLCIFSPPKPEPPGNLTVKEGSCTPVPQEMDEPGDHYRYQKRSRESIYRDRSSLQRPKPAETISALMEARLTCLLYKILRDHLPAGTLIAEVEEIKDATSYTFTNPHIEALARDLVNRMVQ